MDVNWTYKMITSQVVDKPHGLAALCWCYFPQSKVLWIPSMLWACPDRRIRLVVVWCRNKLIRFPPGNTVETSSNRLPRIGHARALAFLVHHYGV